MIVVACKQIGTSVRDAVKSAPAALAVTIALGGTFVVAGCGHSPPTCYVALSPVASAAPRATEPVAPVQLTAVHVPAALDRLEVVVQRSANRLAIDDGARWGAPLDLMMRETLTQDLLARLPEGAVVLPGAPRQADTRTLVVTVLDAHADESGTLTFLAAWTLLSGRPERVTSSRETTLTAQLTSRDAAAQADALSRVLGQLADRIASALVGR
ncbi:hypothetical protein BMUNKI379_12025 [Burkholderia multivorans]|uniref:PqiC family protein n=1 Tax=Burkholderia multivorans TaxID=87883 RepID=UPI0006C81E4F|nr:PqiC family protein [Burkholderia multivorans]KPJ34643.1 hypothetical protein BMUNKI379_12025 [Burkholderia multivorans]MCO8579635.1 membrane integrity-associated transporter subunit PqiC [Burkholderia multivorans]